MDGVDGDFALLMAENHSAEHDVFGQLLGFGLDHQHSRFGTGNHQVHYRIFACGLTGIEDVLAIDITHAGRTDGAAKRHAAHRQGCTDGNQGGDISIHLRVERHGVHHDVHFIEETFGEEGADRAVNEATGQGFKLARAAFALEKAAGDLACGIAFF